MPTRIMPRRFIKMSLCANARYIRRQGDMVAANRLLSDSLYKGAPPLRVQPILGQVGFHQRPKPRGLPLP